MIVFETKNILYISIKQNKQKYAKYNPLQSEIENQ